MKRGPYKKHKVLKTLSSGVVKEYEYTVGDKHSDIEHPLFEQEYYGLGQEYLVCKQFGCGRMLTLQEQLFGNYCINHKR